MELCCVVLQHARFMEGVNGVVFVGPPTREDIQQQCQFALKWDG